MPQHLWGLAPRVRAASSKEVSILLTAAMTVLTTRGREKYR